MNKHRLLRLLLIVALLSVVVPLSLGVSARPEQTGTHAAFNRLQARSSAALTVSWDTRADVPRYLSGADYPRVGPRFNAGEIPERPQR